MTEPEPRPEAPYGDFQLHIYMAGVWVAIATEMLLPCGVAPCRTVGSISGDDLLGPTEPGHRLLHANKE